MVKPIFLIFERLTGFYKEINHFLFSGVLLSGSPLKHTVFLFKKKTNNVVRCVSEEKKKNTERNTNYITTI